jgi:hypothetical protein
MQSQFFLKTMMAKLLFRQDFHQRSGIIIAAVMRALDVQIDVMKK